MYIYYSLTSDTTDITKDERCQTCLRTPKPVIAKEKLRYYQLVHTKIYSQNLYKFVLALAPELVLFSVPSRDDFS